MTKPHDDKETLAERVTRAALDGDLDHIRQLMAAGAHSKIDSDAAARVLRAAENDAVPGAKMRKGLLETLVLHQQQGHINAAMYLAAYNGFDKIVDYFLQKEPADELALNVALFAAARSGRKALAEKLIAAGASVNFKNDLPLRAAIDSGNDDTIKLLLQNGADRAAGMAYAAGRGNMNAAVMLISRDDDIRPALDKICHNLSSSRPQQTPPLDQISVANMLLALAETRGDDMSAHLTWLSFTALREKAGELIETIVLQPSFMDMPAQDRRNLFDVLSPLLRLKENEQSAESRNRNKDAFLAAGGAQAILYAGLARSDTSWVGDALAAGADPRRDQARVWELAGDNISNADARSVQLRLHDAIQSLNAQTVQHAEKVLSSDDLAGALRAVDAARGETGLMAVVDSGKFNDAIKLFQNADVKLQADDFITCDPRGYNLFDRLEDHKQESLLFTPSLWRSRVEEFVKLWDALPPHWQTEHADSYAAVLDTLTVDKTLTRLHAIAETQNLRLLPRRKNNDTPKP